MAIASRKKADIHGVTFGPDDFDSAGRWLEADYDVDGTTSVVLLRKAIDEGSGP